MSRLLTSRLVRAIAAAGVPILSVDIGSESDKSTWRVQPPERQAEAQPTIDAFDVNDPAHVVTEKDAEIDNLPALRALAEATFELKSNAWSKSQFLARIKAIYRAL